MNQAVGPAMGPGAGAGFWGPLCREPTRSLSAEARRGGGGRRHVAAGPSSPCPPPVFAGRLCISGSVHGHPPPCPGAGASAGRPRREPVQRPPDRSGAEASPGPAERPARGQRGPPGHRYGDACSLCLWVLGRGRAAPPRVLAAPGRACSRGARLGLGCGSRGFPSAAGFAAWASWCACQPLPGFFDVRHAFVGFWS